MAQGRGTAIVATVLLLCMVLLHCDNTHAATYAVGDAGEWTFSVQRWPEGKNFVAGDVLVFNYELEAHNVVVVNKDSYDTCKALDGDKVYETGKDQIKLVKGDNFFLCSFPEHCESGMKIAVTAA